MITIRRAYEKPSTTDGKRFLVDRLWPRGVKRDTLRIEKWLKEVAPSEDLRKWFAHDPAKWDVFCERYREELESNPGLWSFLFEEAKRGDITLIYAAKDSKRNNALVLKFFLEEKIDG